jgi:hypothetical protein
VPFRSLTRGRLLDLKTQEGFYNKIVARYMQFCTRYSKDLDTAFASLSLEDGGQIVPRPPVRPSNKLTSTQAVRGLDHMPQDFVSVTSAGRAISEPQSSSSTELGTILMALRKLREGLLASSATAPNPVFSQRVHVFNIRAAILAFHPQGYHPSLLHLLSVLHTREHPLPKSELIEMTTYLILDMAIRQNDIAQAYAMRYKSRIRFGFHSRMVDGILRSLIADDWVAFWRVRQKVDGYVRAILYWHLESQRKSALKAIGRAYYSCAAEWIVQSATGGEMSWEELVEAESVGWVREGDKVLIRKPKARPG